MKRRRKTMKKQLELLALKTKTFLFQACKTVWIVGKDDTRKIVHALKVGISLTLVSLLYLIEPLYHGVGRNSIWAAMTVVLVLEFTAGATLCKGTNLRFGTLCAAFLAFVIQYIAEKSGKVFRAIFIGFMVFLIGTGATYMRFLPYIKRKSYGYGVVVFLLMFNMITVSIYRYNNIKRIALERFYNIAIGCGIALVMSLLVFPNWSGDDLHKSTVAKLELLATSVEACVNEYFEEKETDSEENFSEDPIYASYKTILDSKLKDESLAFYASWEPRHWKWCNKQPWKEYMKLGAMLCHFGCKAVALHGCLHSEIQTPHSVRALFRSPCTHVAAEVSKVLVELADSIRKRRCCSSERLSNKIEKALEDLNNSIKSQPRLFLGTTRSQTATMIELAIAEAANNQNLDQLQTKQRTPETWRKGDPKSLRPSLSKMSITSLEFSEALPFAAFASLLLEMGVRLDLIIDQVEELGRLANFKEEEPVIEIVVNTQVDAKTPSGREFQTHQPTPDID